MASLLSQLHIHSIALGYQLLKTLRMLFLSSYATNGHSTCCLLESFETLSDFCQFTIKIVNWSFSDNLMNSFVLATDVYTDDSREG